MNTALLLSTFAVSGIAVTSLILLPRTLKAPVGGRLALFKKEWKDIFNLLKMVLFAYLALCLLGAIWEYVIPFVLGTAYSVSDRLSSISDTNLLLFMILVVLWARR